MPATVRQIGDGHEASEEFVDTAGNGPRMRRMYCRSAGAVHGCLVALPLWLLPLAAVADVGDPPEVSYPILAAHARSAEGFVPAGWIIETSQPGDLNGDGIADLVLVLRDHDKANVLADPGGLGEATVDTNPRILAVAFGKSAGGGDGFDLVLQNHVLIPRHTVPEADDYFDGIAIKNGTLQVALHLFMSAGGWTAGKIGYVFRFQHSRFEMIGYDSEELQRNTGATTDLSINYATGKAKLTTGTIGDSVRPKVQWKSLPPRKLFSLDDIGDGMDFDPNVALP